MLRILWCGFGLGVTVLTVVLVTLFVPVLPKLVTWHDPKGLLALFLVGGFLVGLIVYPCFAFAAYIRSLKSITSPYYWIGVGGLVALIANVLLAVIFVPYTNFLILNSSIIGGLLGGFIYSLFHEKQMLFFIMRDVRLVYLQAAEFIKPRYAKPVLCVVAG